ncbi:hypothetical protein EXIGLDRAFT_62581 [Exidia glandulosa HHB12029]|uniref:Uncharacterized protein n=1 Tax=Exidia glandulosa HHB12029 TaxID=1314781 RepID=A0A165NZV5_EXIGL|nr:hypothetical protein EXIGLDRAFT_62581 [Exidia glandulosa HHB12029]
MHVHPGGYSTPWPLQTASVSSSASAACYGSVERRLRAYAVGGTGAFIEIVQRQLPSAAQYSTNLNGETCDTSGQRGLARRRSSTISQRTERLCSLRVPSWRALRLVSYDSRHAPRSTHSTDGVVAHPRVDTRTRSGTASSSSTLRQTRLQTLDCHPWSLAALCSASA